MGGLAIIVSAFVGYVVAHIRTEQLKFARAGVTLMLLIVGLAAVGFIDDYLGVRKGRNLGLRKRGKTSGLLAVAAGFALLALRYVDTSTNLSFTRLIDLDLVTFRVDPDFLPFVTAELLLATPLLLRRHRG